MLLLGLRMDEELYKENILDRYTHPRNKKAPEKYDIHEGGANATCGDALIVFLSFDKNARISEAHWDGEGCAISQAAADMLMEKLIGKTMQEVGEIKEEEILKMLGITIGPSREKCAFLSVNTLRRWLGETQYGPL